MADNIFNCSYPPGTKLQFTYSYKGLMKLFLAGGLQITDMYTRNLYDVSSEVPQASSVLVWDSEKSKYYPVPIDTLIKSHISRKFQVIHPVTSTPEQALHLVAFWSADGTLDRLSLPDTKLVDTTEDNTNVKIFTGTNWIDYPLGGTGEPFNSAPIVLTLDVALDPGYIFYWWHDNSASNFEGAATDMKSTYWPL